MLHSRLLIITLLLLTGTLESKPSVQPNILIFLVDDLARADIAIEGSVFHETPHIDSLARSSLRFSNAYCASRVCSPSRASIMTGKAPPRHGITQWIGSASGYGNEARYPVLTSAYRRNLAPEEITLAEAFKEGGYRTFFAGKWHLGAEGSWPEDHGFDINIGGISSGGPGGWGGFFGPWKNPKMDAGLAGESLTLRLAQDTADFIKDTQDQPFLALLSFYAVHAPVETTQALWKKYRDKAELMGLHSNNDRFEFDRRRAVRTAQDNPIYAGMMETLDDAVGIVMEQLIASGIAENTIVIFTSDNGGVASGDAYATTSLPLRGGKGRQWEGGTRAPFYLYAPGYALSNATTDTLAIHMDIYPTLLELANLPARPEQHMDGVSLVPLLGGEPLSDRNLFWHYPHYGNQGGEPSSVIRSGNYKLIHYHEDGRDELYDLSADVGERTDLAAEKAEQVVELRKKLDQWLHETGAKIPQRDPRFKPELLEEYIEHHATKVHDWLEKRSAGYLKRDFVPNEDWWGSATSQ